MLKNLLLLLVVHAGYSQSAIHYSISQGLPSNEVYSIYQDSEGFLWFATDNGVVRYDGVDLKILHVKDGLSDPVVFSFHEDVYKRIWFKTYSGKLSYYDPKNDKIIDYEFNDKIAATVKNGLLNSISTDKLDNLYLTITGKVIKIDKKGIVTQKKSPDKSFVYQDLENESLLGLNPKSEQIEIALINDQSFPIQLSQKKLTNHVACSLTLDGKMLFSVGNDLFEYSNKTVKKVFTGKFSIISLSKDKKGDLWIGYFNRGVELVNSSTYQSEYFNLFRKKSITKVLQDIENGYWFSTLENGVYYLPNKNIDTLNYTKNTKIKSAVYRHKDVITGDQNGYLHFFDIKSRKEKKTLSLNAPIMSIYKDVEDKLWISTNLEVLILDTLNKIQKSISPLTKIDFAKDGDEYVWGTGAFNTMFDLKGNKIKDYKAGTYRSILITDSLFVLAGNFFVLVNSSDWNVFR